MLATTRPTLIAWTAPTAHETIAWNHVVQAMAALNSIRRVVLAGSIFVASLPAQAVLAAPAGVAPTCPQLETRLALVRPAANPTGLNLVLFAAADACLGH